MRPTYLMLAALAIVVASFAAFSGPAMANDNWNNNWNWGWDNNAQKGGKKAGKRKARAA